MQFQGKLMINFWPDLEPLGPNSGRKNFFSKIWLRQSLDTMVSCHQLSTVTPTKIIRPEITAQVVNNSTTEDPKESDINVIKGQLQNLENKLVGKILALKSYFMDEILSLKDQIKDYKINDNVQELSIEKSKDLILLRERVKYLESENKFLKDDIFNKQKLIDKLLENNNKLVDFRSHHVPVQYIQGSQSGSVNGSRSSNDRKYKPVDDNSPQVKLRENKNPINKENHGVVNSASKKRNNYRWRFHD